MKTSSSGSNDNDKPAAERQTELAATPEISSDVAAAPIIDAAALELPSGSGDDDAPLTPHQIAERYKRMEEGISEEKVEETGDDDDDTPLPVGFASYEAIDEGAGMKKEKGGKPELIGEDGAPVHPSQVRDDEKGDGGRRREESGPSNLLQPAAVNELTPAVPFNAAAAINDDEIKRAAAEAAPPMRQGDAPNDVESVTSPPEDEEVEYARSRQRRSFIFRSNPTARGNDRNTPNSGQQQAAATVIRPPPPSMLPTPNNNDDETSTPSVPMFHEVEATLVEEEPEIPIYDAIPFSAPRVTWWQKKRYIIGGMCLLLVGMAVVVGVWLGSNNNEGEESAGLVPPPPSPSKVSTY